MAGLGSSGSWLPATAMLHGHAVIDPLVNFSSVSSTRRSRRGRRNSHRKLKMPLIGYGEAPSTQAPWPPTQPQWPRPPPSAPEGDQPRPPPSAPAGDQFFGGESSTSVGSARPFTAESPFPSSVLRSGDSQLRSGDSQLPPTKRPSRKQNVPAGYTTVFESPRYACRLLMSNTDRIQYLFHGLLPPALPTLPPRPPTSPPVGRSQFAIGDYPPAVQARQIVLESIMVREEVVSEISQLLPSPRLPAECEEMTARLLLDPFALAELRGTLARLLSELRKAAVAVCNGVARWRDAVRRGSPELAEMPQRELTFCWCGCSYLLKMATDLPFLPCPVSRRPHTRETIGSCM